MSHELLKIIILNDDTWEAIVGINQNINFISGFQAAEILFLVMQEMCEGKAQTSINTKYFF